MPGGGPLPPARPGPVRGCGGARGRRPARGGGSARLGSARGARGRAPPSGGGGQRSGSGGPRLARALGKPEAVEAGRGSWPRVTPAGRREPFPAVRGRCGAERPLPGGEGEPRGAAGPGVSAGGGGGLPPSGVGRRPGNAGAPKRHRG